MAIFKRSPRPHDQARVGKSVKPKRSVFGLGISRNPDPGGSHGKQAPSSKALLRFPSKKALPKAPPKVPPKTAKPSAAPPRNISTGRNHRRLSDEMELPLPSPSPIVTIVVGPEGRVFAAHEDVLCQSPFFAAACRSQLLGSINKRIALPDEEPEIFSAVLEYLYKKDYYPRLIRNKVTDSWELEDSDMSEATQNTNPYASPTSLGATSPKLRRNSNQSKRQSTSSTASSVEATIRLSSYTQPLLRDTAIYCSADIYGLEGLKKLALRKQGLQSGIDVATTLRSAQYAYTNTAETDSRLRAHYLALIIHCRDTFKRSGTMQADMEAGGSKLYFDLFVALCNHIDDLMEVARMKGSPGLKGV
ncbi:hypothetical protein CFIMG_008540RA00001 [Ceratocystis fimbriata CBS 114723]|uniref:BTB domain-containing protein n=1 Tax=Ceratocystis fimbriata CBS 114723 TaxID=1035309 RepID=A0A2C5X1F6_9PEZI|nr:hypothetical protein CFIMG_008540RA00001 [Ceratocystis fimbriata CBS 114723]